MHGQKESIQHGVAKPYAHVETGKDKILTSFFFFFFFPLLNEDK
jgi:hypothetical protein